LDKLWKIIEPSNNARKQTAPWQDELTELIADAKKQVDHKTNEQSDATRNAYIFIVEDSPSA